MWTEWDAGTVHGGRICTAMTVKQGKNESHLMYVFNFEKKKDGRKFDPAEESMCADSCH